MKRTLKEIPGYFLSGILTILPLAITIGLLGWIYGKLAGWFGRDSALGGILFDLAETVRLPAALTISLTYIAMILIIILLGSYVSRRAKNRVAEWIKGIMSRFPVVNSIYGSVEQVVGIFSKQSGDDDPARGSKIVLVRFANTLILGMLPTSEEIILGGVPHVAVYFPSTPVPMSGFNYLVPAENVYATDLKFDDLTRVLVSLGSLAPQVLGESLELRSVLAGAGKSGAKGLPELQPEG